MIDMSKIVGQKAKENLPKAEEGTNRPKSIQNKPPKKQVISEDLLNEYKEIDKDKVESLSKQIELVATLGDPSQPDQGSYTNSKGEKVENTIAKIVGYRFRAKVNLKVPHCGHDIFLKSDLMGFEQQYINRRVEVAAGTLFDLTLFETALLLSRTEFNGVIGDNDFVVAYTKQRKQSLRPDGRAKLPTSYIRGVSQSVRTLNQIMVISARTIKAKDGGRNKIEKQAKKGFEKWAALAQERAATASSIKAASGMNEKAVEFNNMVKNISKQDK